MTHLLAASFRDPDVDCVSSLPLELGDGQVSWQLKLDFVVYLIKVHFSGSSESDVTSCLQLKVVVSGRELPLRCQLSLEQLFRYFSVQFGVQRLLHIGTCEGSLEKNNRVVK